jgi:hypothetical protein
MIFEFDDEIFLSQYLSRKINLLHDASIHDEEIMISYLWEDLNVNLTLAILLREDDDTLESFERRVRLNKSATRRVHEQKKSRSFRYYREDREKKFYAKKLFAKLENKKFKKEDSSIFIERVQKLFQKLSIDKKSASEDRKSLDVVTRQIDRKFSRSCRHCEEDHWDNDHKDFIAKVLIAKIFDYDVESLDAENLRTYESLKRVATELSDSREEN